MWILGVFLYENIIIFNKIQWNIVGISEYGSGNYSNSELIFSWAQINAPDAILAYNIANSLYKQWEYTNNMQDKVDYFQKALDTYSWSLNLKYNLDTQDNMIFIEDILKDLQETSQKEQEKGDSKEENFSNGEENRKEKVYDNIEQWEKWEEDDQSNLNKNWQDETVWNWEKDEENKNNSESIDSKENEIELSDEQKRQIEKYSEQLKRSEFYNQKYFNKKPQENNIDINELLRDPFLEDWFQRGWEKDW